MAAPGNGGLIPIHLWVTTHSLKSPVLLYDPDVTEVFEYNSKRFHKKMLLVRDVNTGFWQTGFRLFKTGFKPNFDFTDLHKNVLLYKENNCMCYTV